MSNLSRYKMYIDGAWVEARSGEWFETFDPYAGKPWAMVARGGKVDAERAVDAAYATFKSGEWSKMKPTQRGARLGDLIARDAEKLAALEVRDNGKLLAEMSAQVRYLPQWYYYYGGQSAPKGRLHPFNAPSLSSARRNFTAPERILKTQPLN